MNDKSLLAKQKTVGSSNPGRSTVSNDTKHLEPQLVRTKHLGKESGRQGANGGEKRWNRNRRTNVWPKYEWETAT